MDRLTKAEIECALKLFLPECRVECSLNADGTAVLAVEGPHGEAFAVTGLRRSDYHGKEGLERLARQIFEDIELARNGSQPDDVLPFISNIRIAR